MNSNLGAPGRQPGRAERHQKVVRGKTPLFDTMLVAAMGTRPNPVLLDQLPGLACHRHTPSYAQVTPGATNGLNETEHLI